MQRLRTHTVHVTGKSITLIRCVHVLSSPVQLAVFTNTNGEGEHHNRMCASYGTHQSPVLVSTMSWSVFFFPFLFRSLIFISETAVNYWLTWVLITMQIWGKMKSKPCKQLPYSPVTASWLERRLLWVRYLLSNRSETDEKREKM